MGWIEVTQTANQMVYHLSLFMNCFSRLVSSPSTSTFQRQLSSLSFMSLLLRLFKLSIFKLRNFDNEDV